MARRWWPNAVVAAAMLAVGFLLGDRIGEAEPQPPSFHDMRVSQPEEYLALVDPSSPEVTDLARRLGTLEGCYLFVRDRVVFDPSRAAGTPAQILREGRASCLGKATLLASLYRALGVPADSVRVVTGQVPFEGGLLEHAWVDLEYGSLCLQRDATDLFGVHDFLRFPLNGYVNTFVHRELYCFNEQSFALVSQLNRLRGRHP